MKIKINNIIEEFPSYNRILVSDLLLIKKFSFKLLVIKINNKLIKKSEYEHQYVYDNDNVEIIHLMSGG